MRNTRELLEQAEEAKRAGNRSFMLTRREARAAVMELQAGLLDSENPDYPETIFGMRCVYIKESE